MLVASPQGTLQRISSTGPALGMIPNASFPAAHLPRTPGSTFVAYSDGVSEALDVNGNELGDERVAALVGAHGARPATELCQAIIDAVNQHAHGVRQADDVSVMVVKCE